MNCYTSHWWVTSAKPSWLRHIPQTGNWCPASYPLLPQFSPAHSRSLGCSTEPHPSHWGLTPLSPEMSVSIHLFFLDSPVLAPENTKLFFLGVPSYSFPCTWFSACSFAGVLFLSESPLGKMTSSLNQRKYRGVLRSAGTIVFVGTRYEDAGTGQ